MPCKTHTSSQLQGRFSLRLRVSYTRFNAGTFGNHLFGDLREEIPAKPFTPFED